MASYEDITDPLEGGLSVEPDPDPLASEPLASEPEPLMSEAEPEPLMSVPEPEPVVIGAGEEEPTVALEARPPDPVDVSRLPWWSLPTTGEDLVFVESVGGGLRTIRPTGPRIDPRIDIAEVPDSVRPMLHSLRYKRRADAAIKSIRGMQNAGEDFDQLKAERPEVFRVTMDSITDHVTETVSKTKPVEIVRRLVSLNANARGALWGVAKAGGAALEDLIGPLVMPETLVGDPDERAFESAIGEAYGMTEADLEKMVAQSEELGGYGRLENWRRDVDENVMGMVGLVEFAMGQAKEDVLMHGDLVDLFKSQFQSGSQFTEKFVGGMIGGSAALVRHLPTALANRPMTTMMMILPILKAVRARGMVPDRLGNIINATDEFATMQTRDMATTVKLVPYIATRALRDVLISGKLKTSLRGVPGEVGRSARRSLAEVEGALSAGEATTVLPAEWGAALQRWITSKRYQDDMTVQQIADLVDVDPGAARAEIEAIAGELARATERGDLTAEAFMVPPEAMRVRSLDELRGELPGAAKAAVPEAAAGEVFLHGTSKRFGSFQPQREGHGLFYLSPPSRSPGRKTQAEHIAGGPFGGELAEVYIDRSRVKEFNPIDDPIAADIVRTVIAEVNPPEIVAKRALGDLIPYQWAHRIKELADKHGYNVFEFDEASVQGKSIAVSDPTLLTIKGWRDPPFDKPTPAVGAAKAAVPEAAAAVPEAAVEILTPRERNVMRETFSVAPDDPRFDKGKPIAGIPEKRQRDIVQTSLSEVIPEGATLFHETDAASAQKILARTEEGPRRHGDVYVSDDIDLALGQGGKGVVLEFDPRLVNGTVAPKAGVMFVEGGGREYVVNTSVPGSVVSITVPSERAIASLRKVEGLADLFDFDGAQSVERGIRIERRKRRDVPPPPIHPPAAAAPVAPASALERYRHFRDEILESAMPGEEIKLLAAELRDELAQAARAPMDPPDVVPFELGMAHLDAVIRGVDPSAFGPAYPSMGSKVVIELESMVDPTGKIHPMGISTDTAAMMTLMEDQPALVEAARPMMLLTEDQIAKARQAGIMDDVDALRDLASVATDPPMSPSILQDVQALSEAQPIDVKPREMVPDLSAPIFADLLDPVLDYIQEAYPTAAAIPDVPYEGVRLLQEFQTASQGAQLTRSRAATILTNSLLDKSAQHLRDPKHRSRVAKRIAAGRPGVTVRGVEFKLKELAESTLLDDAIDYRLTIEGESVSFLDEAFAAFDDLPGKERRRVKADTLRQVGTVIAADVEAHKIKAAMMNEVRRGQELGPVGKPGIFAANLVESVLVKGEAPPQLPSRFNPRDIAGHIRVDADKLIPNLVKKLDIEPTMARDMLLDFADEYQFGYTAPRPELTRKLPKSSIAMGEAAYQRGALIAEGDLAPIVRAVGKGYEETVGWGLQATSFRESAVKLWRKLSGVIKGSLTVNNLPAHKNNWLANVGMVGLVRGKTPFGVVADLKASGSLWKQYREGKLTDPELIADFRAIEQSGLLDTSLVDFELAGLDPSETPGPLKAFEQKVSAPAYKFGDNIFKLDEALRNMRILREIDRTLAPGEWMRLELDGKRVTWLTKDEAGQWMQTTTQPKRSPGSNLHIMKGPDAAKYWKEVTPRQVDRLFATAAGKTAKAKFFDYSDVPIWLEYLRSSGAGGIVSPFLTWSWKSLDIPGIKRGLLTEVATGDFAVAPLTNSSVVNGQAMAAAVAVSLRRAALMGGLRSSLLTDDPTQLREALTWLPSDQKTMLVEEGTNPGYLRVMNLRGPNFTGTSDTLFRLGLAAYYKAAQQLDPDWSDDRLFPLDASRAEILDVDAIIKKRKVTPEAARDIVRRRKIALKLKGGAIASAQDVLNLAGMAGSPFMDALASYRETDFKGQEVTAARMFSEFSTMLVGGTPATATSIMMAMRDETTPWSTRRYAIKADTRLTEDFARWATRRLLGWGWRDVNGIEAKKKWADKIEKALKGSLTRDLEDRVKRRESAFRAAVDAGDIEARRAAELGDEFKGIKPLPEERARLDQLNGFIADEVERAVADYTTVMERISEKQRKRRKPPVRVLLDGEPTGIQFDRSSP